MLRIPAAGDRRPGVSHGVEVTAHYPHGAFEQVEHAIVAMVNGTGVANPAGNVSAIPPMLVCSGIALITTAPSPSA
jgi:hypothetical protein